MRPGAGTAPRSAAVTARLRPSPIPAGVSALRLTESRSGWSLSLSLTPELLTRLMDASGTGEPVRVQSGGLCRMHVEPNLLPGEPFPIDEITVVRRPDTCPQSPARTDPSKGVHA